MRGPRAAAALRLAGACVLLLALAIPASAHGVEAAADLHPGLLGMQWRPDPAHASQFIVTLRTQGITNLSYEVCIVGGACIIPPRAAAATGPGEWSFSSADYRAPATGLPYPWPPGARIGVAWHVGPPGNETRVPPARDLADPSCTADIAACAESEYLAFTLPASDGTPAWTLAPLGLVVAAYAARRRSEHRTPRTHRTPRAPPVPRAPGTHLHPAGHPLSAPARGPP